MASPSTLLASSVAHHAILIVHAIGRQADLHLTSNSRSPLHAFSATSQNEAMPLVTKAYHGRPTAPAVG